MHVVYTGSLNNGVMCGFSLRCAGVNASEKLVITDKVSLFWVS